MIRQIGFAIISAILLLVIFLLPACTKTVPPIIPREDLFAELDKTQLRLSPDGQYISYLARSNGIVNVWIAPSASPDRARALTSDTSSGVLEHIWAFTNAHVLYLVQDKARGHRMLYCVHIETGEDVRLAPAPLLADSTATVFATRAVKWPLVVNILSTNPATPDQILISSNERGRHLTDVHRVDIISGESTPVFINDMGFSDFVLDGHDSLRFAIRSEVNGGKEVFQRHGNGWEVFLSVAPQDQATTKLLSLDSSGRMLYMLDSRERNTSELLALDLSAGTSTLLARDETSDLGVAIIHPVSGSVQAISTNFEQKKWKVIDQSIAEDVAFLQGMAGGEFRVVSRTMNDSLWLIHCTAANSPARYYLYERERRKATFLFTDQQMLERHTLATMRPVIIHARDGLPLLAYLSLPPWMADANVIKPDLILPMVVLVRSDAWSRDVWGLNPMHQLFANRGYAVLSVNMRGSMGFGKDFLNAGNRQWGAKMQEDIIDVVQWAVRERIADGDRIAIMGEGYGGYAVLAGLTFTPEVFACGVCFAAPSNLETLLESIPPRPKYLRDTYLLRVGDIRSREGRAELAGRSPLTHASRIEKPLLIAQGARDPRLKKAETERLVTAMSNNEIPVTHILYTDEASEFSQLQNRLSFVAVIESFLATWLGGRAEDIDVSFRNVNATVPTGAEHIWGLPEALDEQPLVNR